MSTSPLPTLASLAEALSLDQTTSRRLTEDCLARIADPSGEGSRTFIFVDQQGARRAADELDLRRKAGKAPSRFAGIPISIKDLADIEGQVTRAGSRALAEAAPAAADAPVVARLRQAGFIIIGRTNMTEFAYSGLGINPHYGTPRSPYERDVGRVPGGSSSGAAVSVADGMAHGALGTDTGGSCRIPASFCGVTGYKPTGRRVPTGGVVPLSFTLDSIGPLARTVSCCAAMDAVMAGEPEREVKPRPISSLRLLVTETMVLEKLDPHVAERFEAALTRLAKAGARISRAPFPTFDRITALTAKGGFSASESYAWHRQMIATKKDTYDPRVLARIMRGAEQSAADYIDLMNLRREAIADFNAAMADIDAIVMPTTPILPPRIADLETDAEYARQNMMTLRNTLIINILDGCSISLPMSEPGAPPCGLMLSAVGGADHRLFDAAAAVEQVLAVA